MDAKQFGRRLRELRAARGYPSQSALARRVKEVDPASRITQGMISIWEAGDSEPKASNIATLADALGVEPGELFKPAAEAHRRPAAKKNPGP